MDAIPRPLNIQKVYRAMCANFNAAEILRDVFGANAAKKIAKRFDVAIITAKVWLAGRFPQTRLNELAAAVKEELETIERRHEEIRKQLGLENDTKTRTQRGEPTLCEVVGSTGVVLAQSSVSTDT